MDQELIRKAAEAIKRWHFDHEGLVGSYIPIDELSESSKANWLGMAEAALKVFYEHTRSQDRTRGVTLCPDCNATMKPTLTSPTILVCPSCGRQL